MQPLPARLRPEALHLRLCQRIAELHRPLVADVMRVFLDVSSSAVDEGLWSLEFAFDEDEGRVARMTARFWDAAESVNTAPEVELPGYVVQVVLPRVMPLRTPLDRAKAAEQVLAVAEGKGALVARFVRALTDLGAYRAVEPVHAVSAEAHLL